MTTNKPVARKNPKKRQSPLLPTNILLVFVILLMLMNLVMELFSMVSEPPTSSEPAQITTSPTPSTPTLQTWEYKTLQITDRITGPFGSSANAQTLKTLNDLGAKGWELVGFTFNPGGIEAAFVFKRPLVKKVE